MRVNVYLTTLGLLDINFNILEGLIIMRYISGKTIWFQIVTKIICKRREVLDISIVVHEEEGGLRYFWYKLSKSHVFDCCMVFWNYYMIKKTRFSFNIAD